MQPHLCTNKNQRNSRTLSSYKKLRQSTALPLKIKMFYALLQNCVEKHNSKVDKPVQISKDFEKKYKILLSAYKHQTEQEKIRILYDTLKIVKNNLVIKEVSEKESQKDCECISSESDGLNQIRQIQTTCRIKESILGITKWDKKGFRFNRKQMKIKFIGLESKKQLNFNLKFYFIRKSIKHSRTLILEAITPEIQNKIDELYFSFDDSILFEEIYEAIFSCVAETLAKYLITLSTSEKEKDMDESTSTGGGDMSKASVMMTPKVLNEYFQEKDKILRKLQNCSYNFQTIQSSIANTKIGISLHKQKTRIKIDKIFHENCESIKKKLSLLSRNKSKNLVEFQILERFSSNIYVAYFKYFFDGEIYEFLTIMEENYKPQLHTLIFKGIDNFINKQFVDFLCISLKEQNNMTFMQLVGIVKSQFKKKKMIVDFLLSLVEPVDQTESVNNNSHLSGNVTLQDGGAHQNEGEQQFWTVRNFQDISMEDIQGEQSLHIIKDHNQYKQGQQNFEVNLPQSVRNPQIDEKSTMKFLNRQFRYIVDPRPKQQGKFIQQHYLFKDWRLSKSGGFVCTNQEQINEQKKVFKWILSELKKSVFKGKSILNVSFPVTIFRDQSHLKSCARNFSYAPVFLEKAVGQTPLERIKQAILLHISMANLIISMNKPFNPILGQTYQGQIDGCPYFAEQISHHPPITRYIFYGRGYKIEGTMQPKLALGLNCAKGWSPQPNFIRFDDGEVIQFTNNKMVINGLLFGERSFAFDGSNYVLDRKNRIGAQILYRAQPNSFFKKNQSKTDEVTAEVYRIDKNTVNQPWEKIKREGKQSLMMIEGVWHSEVRIDGKLVLDFAKFLPHPIYDYSNPIPSDSSFRTDIKELSLGNMENAQAQKDYLQNVQRNDKKLRQAFEAEHRQYLQKQM